MKQSTLYLALCGAGIIFPWILIGGFLTRPDATVTLFLMSLFTNQVDSAVAADLFVSSCAFFVYVAYEGRRMGMRHLWAYVPATLFVGLSFGLPLFLALRAKKTGR